jgi:hypothetical protein
VKIEIIKSLQTADARGGPEISGHWEDRHVSVNETQISEALNSVLAAHKSPKKALLESRTRSKKMCAGDTCKSAMSTGWLE